MQSAMMVICAVVRPSRGPRSAPPTLSGSLARQRLSAKPSRASQLSWPSTFSEPVRRSTCALGGGAPLLVVTVAPSTLSESRSSLTAIAATSRDATISARVYSEGSIRRDYGLLLRVTDDWDDSFRYQPRAGYRCTINTGRDGKADSTLSVEVLREDGSRSTLVYAPAFTLEPGTWYAVSGSAIGNHIQCRIFGATGLLGSAGAFDDTYGDGYFATWNYKDDSGPHWWGDLRINDVPPPAARRLRGSR